MTNAPSGSIAAALIGRAPVRILEGRNRTKADVSIYSLPLGSIALKSYAARPAWIRGSLGRWLVRRECAAYAAAQGVRGLPEFLGRAGPHAFATRWIDARPLSARVDGPLVPEVFERLRAILDDLHARGIALGDLHHRDVLVSDDGSVHVVDLATAIVAGDRPGWMRRWLFERFRESDEIAFLRIRSRFLDALEPDLVALAGARAAGWHARGRHLKALLDLVRGRVR